MGRSVKPEQWRGLFGNVGHEENKKVGHLVRLSVHETRIHRNALQRLLNCSCTRDRMLIEEFLNGRTSDLWTKRHKFIAHMKEESLHQLLHSRSSNRNLRSKPRRQIQGKTYLAIQ